MAGKHGTQNPLGGAKPAQNRPSPISRLRICVWAQYPWLLSAYVTLHCFAPEREFFMRFDIQNLRNVVPVKCAS